MTARITLSPTTAYPSTTVDVTGTGFDPKAKYDLTTLDANGNESGKADLASLAAADRPRHDGSFATGIYAPPVIGPAYIRAYQNGVIVASASLTVALKPVYLFSDDFEGTALSPKWGHHWPCCGTINMDPTLSYVKDGFLHLPVVKRSDGWYGDLVDTRDSFQLIYGKFEARMKIVTGQGLWPAFWLYSGNFGTDGDEIDIMEICANPLGTNGGNDVSYLHQTVHKGSQGNQIEIPNGRMSDLSLDWHVYGVEWRPTYIAFTLDGKETWRDTSLLISTPKALILNHGVGGSWAGSPDSTTPSPAELLVDWVRVSV